VPRDRPLRTSPLTIALEAVGLVLFGVVLAFDYSVGGGIDVPQLVIGFLLTLQRTVGWWFRTYTVTDTAITLDEGILQRRHRVVPFTRVQQVELRQQLTSRLFGITTVHVETAGDAGSTAISLRSLDLVTAEALREHLLAEQRRVRAGAPPGSHLPGEQWSDAFRAPARTPLVHLSPSTLLIGGLTGGSAVSAPLLVAIPAAVVAGANVDGPGAVALFALLVGLGTLGFAVFGAVGALLYGWGFDLAASDDDLHVVHGLLDRRQHTMPRHRLQHVRVLDNPVQRRLGIARVDLFSAATPGARDGQQTTISIPVARRDALGDLLAVCMGSDRWRPPPLEPRPPVARRRAVLRRTAVSALLVLPIVLALAPAGLVLTPLALLGIPWGRVAHRRAGHALHGDVLAVASGAVVHHLELVPVERIQSRRSSSTPLQRRVDIATVRLDVAGARRGRGAPGLRDVAADLADAVRRTVPRPAPSSTT
jgi:putative membrane protein